MAKKNKVKPDLSTPENRAFWESVKKASAEVRSWPAWKRGRLFDAARTRKAKRNG